MLYYQRGTVNTSLVTGVCRLFCTALTVLLTVVVALGLHVQMYYTHHCIIELRYLTCLCLTRKDPNVQTKAMKEGGVVAAEHPVTIYLNHAHAQKYPYFFFAWANWDT